MLIPCVLAVILLPIPAAAMENDDRAQSYHNIQRISNRSASRYQANTRYINKSSAPDQLYHQAKRLGSVKKTLWSLKEILSRYPGFRHEDRVLDDIASIYYIIGDYRNSYRYFYRLFKAKPHSSLWDKSIYYMCKILMKKKRYDKARELVKSNISSVRNRAYGPRLLHLVGQSFYLEKEYPRSVRFYQKMLREMPGNNIQPVIYFHLGNGYRKMGNQEMAHRSYNKLIKRFPGSIESGYARNILKKAPSEQGKAIRPSSYQPVHKGKKYYLQLGYFSKQRNAQKLSIKVKDLGINCRVISRSSRGKKRYLLVAGPYESEKRVRRHSQKLSDKGIRSIIHGK